MDFAHAFEAYRRFDPAGWLLLYRLLPVYAGLLLAAGGVALLLFAGDKLARVIGGPLGFLVGGLWVPVVAEHLVPGAPMGVVGLVAGLAVGALGIAYVPGLGFLAAGLPAGLFLGHLAGGDDWMLGFLPGLLLCGSGGVVLHRHVVVMLTCALGAWLLVLGLLSPLHLLTGVESAVGRHPGGALAAAALFAVAGAVYQLAVRPSPAKAEQLRAEALSSKKRDEERAALERRWANYSSQRERQ
jgi:hypothetical protein